MSEFYKEIDRYEMLELEKYCKRFGNDKFSWKKIDAGYLIEIRIKKEEDVYIFQSVG